MVRICLLGAMLLITGLITSTGLDAADRDYFAATMRAHFRASEMCIRGPNIPNRRTVEKEIETIEEAAKRFWPDNVEAAKYRLMYLMLTEGGGSTKGKKKDPNKEAFGPLHVHYDIAVTSAKVYNIKWIKKGRKYYIDTALKGGEKWFKAALRGRVRFAIICAAGALKICDNKAGGNWQRGILIYKYGEGGVTTLLNAYKNRSLNTVPTWKHFVRNGMWVGCHVLCPPIVSIMLWVIIYIDFDVYAHTLRKSRFRSVFLDTSKVPALVQKPS